MGHTQNKDIEIRKWTSEEEDFHQEWEGDGRGDMGVTKILCIDVCDCKTIKSEKPYPLSSLKLGLGPVSTLPLCLATTCIFLQGRLKCFILSHFKEPPKSGMVAHA